MASNNSKEEDSKDKILKLPPTLQHHSQLNPSAAHRSRIAPTHIYIQVTGISDTSDIALALARNECPQITQGALPLHEH